MKDPLGIAALAALVVVALGAMRLGWRHRVARSEASVGPIPAVPDVAALGEPTWGPAEATYVSTTAAGDWLDRVAAHDLGVRSRADVSVHPSGVLVARTGARDVFIPAAALRDVMRSPGIAGKVVGRDGLVVLRWELDGNGLDTGLRPRHAADRATLLDAVRPLITTAQPGPAGSAPDVSEERTR